MAFHFPFFESAHLLALLVALVIFLLTILLAFKRWIGFPIAFLLLIFALTAGILINYRHDFGYYFSPAYPTNTEIASSDVSFQKHMIQALEDLKMEVSVEKETLRKLASEVKEIFDSMDAQKQKLQNFIDEVREQFKSESREPPSSSEKQENQ